jgi:hypothetical protein
MSKVVLDSSAFKGWIRIALVFQHELTYLAVPQTLVVKAETYFGEPVVVELKVEADD